MRYCSECKHAKKGTYCNLCKKDTSSNFIIRACGAVFRMRFPLIKMKHKRPGIKKFLSRALIGWSEAKGANKTVYPDGVNIWRLIDRENNKYREVVIDCKSNRKIRDIDEPLNEHIPNKQRENNCK